MINDNAPYSGSERRREQRRKQMDRRELIRFEPSKEPRRKSHGRRTGEAKDMWEK